MRRRARRLRQRILAALDRKVLGDMAHYTRCLEAAYRTALAEHGMTDAADGRDGTAASL